MIIREQERRENDITIHIGMNPIIDNITSYNLHFTLSVRMILQ